MVEVKNLVKVYGRKKAVDGLTFNVEENQVYGFLGPNGAGKSTTMNIITGCLSATEGTVCINGHDIFEEPYEAKRQIGYLPEQPPLYMDMTPKEYLTFMAQAKKIKKASIPSAIDGIMRKTSILNVKDRLIKNLSKGYKQRVGIAGALVGNPPVIILDEPTVGLDPKQIIEIRSLIKELGKNHTVILSSHILSEVNSICDKILIISRGKLIADDTPENLTKHFREGSMLNVLVRCGMETAIEVMDKLMAGLPASEKNIWSSENAKTDTHLGEVTRFKVPLYNENNTIEGKDIRDSIFKAFGERNITVLEMSPEKASLEQVFLELTASSTEEEYHEDEAEEEEM